MSDTKKDLTGILEYSEKLQDAGQAPPAPEGSVLEEAPVERIDAFESLDDYAKHNPSAEAPPEEEFALEPPPPSDDFAVTTPEPGDASSGGNSFDFVGADDAEPVFEPPPPAEEPLPEEPVAAAPPPHPTPQPATPAETLERVKNYSERVSVGKPPVTAELPFSLLIEGHLAADEKERLLDLLSRENMGIRDLDLEPQFEGGRILIPRISEYAGVMLVQALRGARCKIRLGPSDEIYSTDDTRSTGDDPFSPSHPDVGHSSISIDDQPHPAETMPLTADSSLPGLKQFTVIDVVTASATLSSGVVEAKTSHEYQEIVEALQRELRYKAFHRGATAVLNYSIQLTTLNLPTRYRLTAAGSAIRTPSQSAS